MALLKSIFILVFCIGWVKAANYNINNEFDKIFHEIRNSFEHAWKWMQTAANTSFLRLNEIFSTKRSMGPGQYKYQDITTPSNNLPLDNQVQVENISPLNTTKSSQLPKHLLTTQQPSTTLQESASQEPHTTPQQESTTPEVETTQEPLKSDTSTVQPDQAATEPSTESSSIKNETEVPQQVTEETESECQEDSSSESPVDQVHLKVQAEAVIPSEGDQNNALDLPVAQDIKVEESQTTETQPNIKIKIVEPIVEDKPQIIIPDRNERIEFESKRGLTTSVYEQQNIIILFLFFLMLIMFIYYFLLSKTSNQCPTIVIGDLNGNLKPTVHHIKK